MSIVIDSPGFDLRPRIFERQELVDVQTLVAQSPVKTLDVAVFRGFSGSDEVELYASAVGPLLERNRGEFGPVIDRDGERRAALHHEPLEHFGNAPAREAEGGLNQHTFPTPLINHGQHPDRTPV